MSQSVEISSIPHFELEANQSLTSTIAGVGRAAYTLFNVPDHDSSLYEDLAKILIDKPQPIHLPVEEEVAAIKAGPAELVDPEKLPKVDNKHLLGHVGLLMQFTSYLPKLRPYGRTQFGPLEQLYSGIIEQGKEEPLGYAAQLDIALRQTDGDLPEAIWRLFLTSRQYGRWFDSGMIEDMPEFTRDEKLGHMQAFATSVLACKPHEQSPVQDTAGDTYYTWTHALGGLMLGPMAAKPSPAVKLGAKVIRNGTNLMHSLAHRYKPQRLASDHSSAAVYGNAIGDTLVGIYSSEN